MRLEGVELAAAAGLRAPQPALGEGPVLRIPTPPVQITGRWMARVRLVKALPGREGAGGDLFVVRHYDPRSHSYGGPQETVRIPSQPPNRDGRRFFETTGLLDHPIGAEGWTVYGAPPRASPRSPGATGTPQPTGAAASGRTALELDGMARPWAIGDHALLLHAFGGIQQMAYRPAKTLRHCCSWRQGTTQE